MVSIPDAMPPCPGCRATNSIALDAGVLLCLDCRYEWDPTTERAALTVLPDGTDVDPEVAAELYDVLTARDATGIIWPHLTPAELYAEHTGRNEDGSAPVLDLTGRFVTWEGSPAGLVTEDQSPARVLVQLADGTEHEWPRHEVELLPETYSELGAVELAEGADDDGPDITTVMAVAGLILSIAADVVTDDEARTLLPVPIGWLPPPANDVPEVEWGAAYACAILIAFYGLPLAEVQEIARNTIGGVQAATTEGNTQ